MESTRRTYEVRTWLVGSVAMLACATPTLDKPWVEVSTRNFRIITSLPESEAFDVAEDLELFRAVVLGVTNTSREQSSVPTRIYIFGDAYDYRPFQPDYRMMGYFLAGMRANYAALGLSRRNLAEIDVPAVVYHEYIHFILSQHSRLIYPAWYEEGFAEFMRTLEFRSGEAWIGNPPMDRFRGGAGVLMPLRDLLRGVNERVTGDFYLSAWALVHYLHLGREGRPDVAREVARYVALMEEGSSEIEAFEEVFGLGPRELDEELVRYLESGRIPIVRVPLSRLGIRVHMPASRSLSRAELAVALGELALAHRNLGAAGTLFAAAREADPTNARAHAGGGNVLCASDRAGSADPLYRRALEIGDEDALVHLDYARCLHGEALESGPAGRPGEILERARHHYDASWRLDPNIPETYALHGLSFLATGQDPSRGVPILEHAYSLLPSNHQIVSMLACAYERTGRADEARVLAVRAAAWSHAERRDDRIGDLLESCGK